MSDQSYRKRLPIKPSLEHLKKQAKRRASKDPDLKLSKAQHLLAQEYGCKNWDALMHMVETMLRGSDQLVGYKNEFEALPKAADQIDLEKVREILATQPFTQHDLDLALARCLGRFPRSKAIAELLLDHGADPDGQYGSDYGPIIFVTGETLDDEGLAFMIEAGADVSFEPIQNKYGSTSPLGQFLKTYLRGKNDQKHRGIDLLLEHKAVIPTEVGPEMLAIHRGDIVGLKKLLVANPDLVHQRYPDMAYGNVHLRGATLLHAAMEFQELECVDLLLSHGADINAPALTTVDENGIETGGQSPMFHLVNAWGGHGFELLKHVLKEYGHLIDWEITASFKQFDKVKGPISLQDWLQQNEKEWAMVEECLQQYSWNDLLKMQREGKTALLLQALQSALVRETVFKEDKYGHSLFSIWAGKNAFDLLEALESYGINWDIHLASAWGRLDLVQELLAEDPTRLLATKKHIENPLHVALRHGRMEVAQWLYEQGVDLASTESSGYVRSATFGKHPEAIRWAVEHGADIDYPPEGESALYHETKHGHWRMVPTLLELGADPQRRCESTGKSPLEIAKASKRKGKLLELLEAASK